MPVHDWTCVSAGTFHHFHNSWLTEMSKVLTEGILQPPYYALAEQVAGETYVSILAEPFSGGAQPERAAGSAGMCVKPLHGVQTWAARPCC